MSEKLVSIDIGPPPPGFEILPIETDDDEVSADMIRFKSPEGEIMDLNEMIALGHYPDEGEDD